CRPRRRGTPECRGVVVADVVRLPGLFEQIRLVAGLRWRILRNNLKNKQRVLDLIGVVISSIMGIFLVVGIAIGVFAGTISFLQNHHEARMALLFWGIFLWWQVMPIFVAGFFSSFFFFSLLRVPLSFFVFFLFWGVFLLCDSAALSSLIWLFTMALATAIVNFALFPAMLLACALFLIVNVTLERLVGSWVEKILSKRRSREVFFALFVMLMVSLQFLNPILQKYGNSAKPEAERIVRYVAPFPGSLAGRILSANGPHHIFFFLVLAARGRVDPSPFRAILL